MNLLFRMILTFCKALFAQRIEILSPSTLNFRVLPFDLDINFHLTNSRYLSFMDLGRLYYVGQVQLIKTMFKNRWQPIAASCEISFIRQVRLFSKVTLTTQLITWDEKYQYFYQRFSVKGHIVATALIKTAAYAQGKAVPCAEIIQQVDPNLIAPPMPESIQAWQQFNQKKREHHG